MAYFEPSIDADGIHIPTYADIMEYLTESYKAIFGEDVYLGEETKDYQLLSIFAKCLDDYAALVVGSYNARNPNYAEGDSLDLLLPLISMKRRPATHSTAVLTLTGRAGETITAGQSALDENGYLWVLDEDATLEEDDSGQGKAKVAATCSVAGAIAAGIGTINRIYTPVIGWSDVTNEEEAVAGLDTETDDELRARRKRSVNVQNNGISDSVIRALLNLSVDGRTLSFARVLTNNDGEADANGIPAHSICCVVDGLDDNDYQIGEAIWKSKAPGIGTYGGPEGETRRIVEYEDAYGNMNTIYFARPQHATVSVEISLNALSGFDEDRVIPIIKSAITNEINNLGIGNSWGVTTAYRDIYNAFAGETCPFVVASVTGQTEDMAQPSSVEVECAFNQMLTIGEDDITITVTY